MKAIFCKHVNKRPLKFWLILRSPLDIKCLKTTQMLNNYFTIIMNHNTKTERF